MKIIKSAIAAASAALMFAVAGCKSTPTPTQMKSTATAIGVAAGLVANETKIDDKSREAIITVMLEVIKATPAEGQSFEEAWTPLAKEIVAKLVADGKLDEKQSPLVLTAFAVAVKGIDYIFDVRFPKARQYEELVAAAIEGFSSGFLSVFTPPNAKGTVSAPAPDEAALVWLKKKFGK